MTISTDRFFNNNSELFNKLNSELKSLQAQAGSGNAEIKLGKNISDVAKLNAAEEKKSEINQFLNNAKRVQTDLEILDVALERVQNLLIRLQELAVESANDVLLPEERARFSSEVAMIKSELVEVGNQKDNFGNSLFGGISGTDKPFEVGSNGHVKYNGSSLAKEIQVTSGLAVKQNFSGIDVFDNVKSSQGAFSIFSIADDLIDSLQIELNSGTSANLFSESSTAILRLPNSGPEADVSFKLLIDGKTVSLNEKVYGSDYSGLANKINSYSGQTGITATYTKNNQLSLQGDVDNLIISDFDLRGSGNSQPVIEILDQTATSVVDKISIQSLENSTITGKITDTFEHIATKRAEVSASFRRAQDAEVSTQNVLITLEEDISEIRDADLATILTQLELLMTQKDAAQATFTRITSKSLFDFLS